MELTMINIPGQLAIRTISGRNGDFNVGRLSTSIGEFVIKDALLDQYSEGKYRGDFLITEIRPSYYSTGGRLVVEIRAKMDSMSLDDVDMLTAEDAVSLSPNEPDPIDEQPTHEITPTSKAQSPEVDTPFGMPPSIKVLDEETDAALFGTIWPLGEITKLDTTVDRQRLRDQCIRLGELGYELDFKQQTWKLKAQ